jgi:hypothetical protein
MKVTIDIPEEFVSHYNGDKFRDSLQRLKDDAHLVAGNYEKEVVDMLIKAFKNAKEEDAPKSPTPLHPRWKPERDEHYYTIDIGGACAGWETWDSDNLDGDIYSLGFVFKTEAEADFALERMKVLAEMQEWAGKWDDPVILQYNMINCEIVIRYCPHACNGEIRFSNSQDAIDCIKAVGEDRIKKYYFMIPEDKK